MAYLNLPKGPRKRTSTNELGGQRPKRLETAGLGENKECGSGDMTELVGQHHECLKDVDHDYDDKDMTELDGQHHECSKEVDHDYEDKDMTERDGQHRKPIEIDEHYDDKDMAELMAQLALSRGDKEQAGEANICAKGC